MILTRRLAGLGLAATMLAALVPVAAASAVEPLAASATVDHSTFSASPGVGQYTWDLTLTASGMAPPYAFDWSTAYNATVVILSTTETMQSARITESCYIIGGQSNLPYEGIGPGVTVGEDRVGAVLQLDVSQCPVYEAPEMVDATMGLTSSARSGEPFTFHPVYPDGFVISPDAVCGYVLSWGDAQSLLHNDFDETYGAVMVTGLASAGYCSDWTLTLPYSAAGQWQWDFNVVNPYGDPTVHFLNGRSDEAGFPQFGGTNGAPLWAGITSSTIPGVWLSMTRSTFVGSLITVIAHPFGGYVQPSTGANFMADAKGIGENTNPRTHQIGLTWKFAATTPGMWSVFYNDDGDPNHASAGVDPLVKAAPSTQPTAAVKITTAKTVRVRHYLTVSALASGMKGTVTYKWSINGHRIFVGRTGRLLFTSTGRRTVTVVATDRYGHRATKSVFVTVVR